MKKSVFIGMSTSTKKQRWINTVLASAVIPAAFAIIPGIRKRYHLGMFSLPSLAMVGGLWLWERHAQRKAAH
jgi:hypothetical protein